MRSEPPTGDELARLLVSMKRNVIEQVANEPARARRLPATNRIIGFTLGVTLLLGIGTGAAFALGVVPPIGVPAPVPDASSNAAGPSEAPSPTPVPSEYEVIPGQPASRYDLSCESLLDAALVSRLFTVEVAPTDPIITASGIGISIPRRTSILAQGGLLCESSNGLAYNDQYGGENWAGVTVSVLPRPPGGWTSHAQYFGMPLDTSACSEFGSCSASAAVGDAWVTIDATHYQAENVVNASEWQPLVDSIIAAVNAVGPATQTSPPPRTGEPFPSTCNDILPLEVVQSITATSDLILHGSRGDGPWSEYAEARVNANNEGCSWGPPTDFDHRAAVDFVREGRWAFERMLQIGRASCRERVL